MDPITTAVIAAPAGGVASGTAESVTVISYQALKSFLKRKFGKDGEVVKAVNNLEARPDSAGRKETLKEEVLAARADQDPEILEAAWALLDRIGAQAGGEHHIQTATGSYIAQADQSSTATVEVNHAKE
jgi:hypothetical protein